MSESEIFDKKMSLSKISEITTREDINGVSKSEIEKLYTDKLSNKRTYARKYYDKLLQGAPQGICPYCNYREATTLDHFLPKAHYTPLVITPANLVPACKDCNTAKDDVVVKTDDAAFFNPYYEDIDSQTWLIATLIENVDCKELTMIYSVDESISKKNIRDSIRLKNQFERLGLGNVYGIQASRELLTVKRRCIRIYKLNGRASVLQDIKDNIKDRYDNPNSWQSAMYRGLKTIWFLDEWLPRHLAPGDLL